MSPASKIARELVNWLELGLDRRSDDEVLEVRRWLARIHALSGKERNALWNWQMVMERDLEDEEARGAILTIMAKGAGVKLHPEHPVLAGARLLSDGDVLEESDETACTSTLLDPINPEPWVRLEDHADLSGLIGRTVAEALEGDMDAAERVFRRP